MVNLLGAFDSTKHARSPSPVIFGSCFGKKNCKYADTYKRRIAKLGKELAITEKQAKRAKRVGT